MTIEFIEKPFHPLLGRHVRHDSRSLRYAYPYKSSSFQVVRWESEIPVLDQGQLGACTGFATVTCLGHKPYRGTLPGAVLDNVEGVKVYSLATSLDSYAGTYPPNDTGSDGLSAAKAAKQLGFIAGYTHITKPAQLAAALLGGPVIVGTDWFHSMFQSDSSGNITVDSGSGLAGGHEYTLDEVTSDGRFGFTNSWGPTFGATGRFYIKQADFLALLSRKGDATVFVPIGASPPIPTPTPPGPSVDMDALAAYRNLQVWAKRNGV